MPLFCFATFVLENDRYMFISSKHKVIALILLLLEVADSYGQAGKDGAVTITTANTVVNRYARVINDVAAGSNFITVDDINNLNRDGISYLPAGFVTNASVYANNALSPGDLIIIYQAQGAIINSSNTINYGEVINYNGAGTYEFAQVASVSGNNIYLACRTKYSYFAARYVQVIRVPQYTTLTINPGASIAAVPWGSPAFGGTDPSAITRRRGGFVAVHASSIVNDGAIHANAAGFRGGTRDNNSATSGANFYTDYRTTDSFHSAEKGESIAGYREDYDNLYGGRYGRGAPANGGGGGNAHNSGGGGGANGGNPAGWFRGAGVMNDFRPATGGCGSPGAWALDPDYIANGNALTNSQGGGRGGYSFANSNQNACTLGPSYPANFIAPGNPPADVLNTAWGGDRRDAVGGLGGRPLVSNNFQNQIFFGGGGGAGDGNNNANADGGDGGGIVFLVVSGNITGNGLISANGENAPNTIGGHNDAPGGGGGGGTIVIQANTIANSITISANGGKGGDQLITNFESEGPGGGGGGGVIVINAITDGSTKQVNGGENGTTSSASVTEFIANGATSGNSGTISTVSVSLFSIVCTANLDINKSVDNSNPNVGSNVTFTLTASNAGPDPATNVVVNDLLPTGYTFVSATPSQGTYNNVTGVWNVGSLGIGGSATLTIVATVNASGPYTNTATISTPDQNDPVSSNNSSSVTPTPVNAAPDAIDDSYTMPQNATLTNSVASNDILQPSGNPHTFTLVSGGSAAANGTLTFNPDGTFTYVPNTGFSGTVSFTYQVCNGVTPVNQCDTAVATIVVLPPPVAVNDNAVTPINTPVSGNLSSNDNLPSGGTYTYTVATPPNPAEGTVTINPDGTYTFTPATGFTGTATFTYEVCNQLGQCSTATVSVSVLPPPVAVNDTATTPINTPVNGNASTNDNLPSGGTYTYTVTTPPANGSVTMNPDGTYTYTPNTGFTGTDVFTYQVCNQVGQCSSATVTINVPPSPVAVNDSAITPINTPVGGNLGANDNLPAGFTYTFSLVDGGSAAANGTLVVNPDGTYSFTPNTGFSGVVTFTYQVCNEAGICSTAIVTITVLAPPVANDDTIGTTPNTPVNGNVTPNDVLPAGGTYTFTVTIPPTNGSVTMNPDGSYTYTPNPGFVGSDTFTYTVCNQLGECSSATVTITVGQPPLAVNDEYNTGAGVPVSGNVGTNDQNPSGGTTTFTLVSGGTATQNGTLVFNPDGTFTFTPNQGFSGTVTFTYEICNPVGCSQATVTINVAPPIQAVDDNFVTTPGNPVSGNLGTNDVIPAGQTPTFSLVNGGTAAQNGTLVVNPDGSFTFTPNPGFVGTVSFTYQVCNQFGQCSTATVTIVIEDPVVQIPEGFSPNNDGINDTFVIKGRNGRPVTLRIYNRWGNLVYENLNYQDDWSGTSNVGIRIGEQLPDGTYFYVVEFKDTGERFARYLTIQR